MGEALEAGYNLAALALLFVALALLLIAKGLAQAIAGAVDVSILGRHPFAGVGNFIESHLVRALDGAIKDVEKGTAKFESGLIDAFGMLIAIPLLLAQGTKAALEYLWSHALRPLIHSIVEPIKGLAEAAAAKVVALATTVARNLAHAEEYARARAAGALSDAEAYTDDAIAATRHALRAEILEAEHAAERFAEQAVGRLRAAEDEAVAGAVAAAAAAKAAGIAAASAAEHAAEQFGETALSAAERAAAEAIAAGDAATREAIAAVKGLAAGIGDDLATIEGAIGAAGVAGLIAAIPALATLVHAIATEAGLDSAECRGKVKGICGTNPARWAELLAGLALAGVGFNLRELAELANRLAREAEPLVREIAKAA